MVGVIQFTDHLGDAGNKLKARRRRAPAFFETEQGLVQVQDVKQGYQSVAGRLDLHGDGAGQAGGVLAGQGAQPLRQVEDGGIVGINQGAIQVEEDGFDGGGEEASHAGGEMVNG